METPNIQLYNFLRHDFDLTDIKSLEFMNLLDKEYRSGLKMDLTNLDKKMNEGFQDIKAEFGEFRSDMKAEFSNFRSDMKTDFSEFRSDMKAEFAAFRSDSRAELTDVRGDLRVEIRDSKVETIRWTIGFFLGIALMILAMYLKK